MRIERSVERDRAVALAPRDGEQSGFRRCAGLRVDRPPAGDEPARFSTTRRSTPSDPVLRMIRRERPVTSVNNVGAEALDDLVKRVCTGGSDASFSIRRSRRATASRLCTG